MDFEHRCWAEVDLDRLSQNFRKIKAAAAGAAVAAVVKADAYGHGDKAVCRALAAEGADWFAVSNLEEALRVRSFGLSHPILILGYTPPCHAAQLSRMDIVQAVYGAEYARALSQSAEKAGCTVRMHIKLDTGMGRIGFSATQGAEAAAAEIAAACGLPCLRAEGLFTHFAVADSASPDDQSYTEKQYGLLLQTVEALKKLGVSLPLIHCSNSAALFAYPAMRLDMVRPGIVLYGCAPSSDVACPGLLPVLQLKAAVSLVKTLKAGQCVSYGRIFTAAQDMTVATVTCGYADGYPRSLSNKGVASVKGRPAPVIGRVCMDQLLIDISGIPGVRQGDTVTLYGDAPADTVTEAAEKTGTINYELLCHLSRRVPRVYLRGGKVAEVQNYLEV
ncbi:MAG: alanine racemase [Oscillospiraceae bacterium]|nr:alanine racemase [Oscillospiraceae bacterium]